MMIISQAVGLSFKQAYKWLWDRKIRDDKQFIRSLKSTIKFNGKFFEIEKSKEINKVQ